MARITQEQIEQINEVYAQCKVKSQTAKIVGVSVASVNKYLIPDYVPRAERVSVEFTEPPRGVKQFVEQVKNAKADNFFSVFSDAAYDLTSEEWADMETLRKGIL